MSNKSARAIDGLTNGISRSVARHPLAAGSIATAALFGLSALINQRGARQAERDNAPRGSFITVDGVRLHFIDTGGSDPVLVLLHGNGAMIADMEISGLVRAAAERYRVIVFDRPGFGYSERPSDRTWGPEQQARLFHDAFAQMGLERPIVLGHSWGTQVALSLALDFPGSVSGLVLASGYYFPSARVDTVTAMPAKMPLLGNLMRHTISPLFGRLMAPLIFKKMFSPKAVPAQFSAEFPVALTLRPGQIKASAEETVMMVGAAMALKDRYGELQLPVCILAGDEDKIVDSTYQSAGLHEAIDQSELKMLPGLGHMLHYAATDQVVSAIDSVAKLAHVPARVPVVA